MSTHSSPDTMTWRFDGYEMRLDEDGLSLHVRGSRGFEQPEVLKLIERFTAIREQAADGFAAPTPPTRDQIRDMGYAAAEAHGVKESIKALQATLAAIDNTPPF
jgi:hypothetical protein